MENSQAQGLTAVAAQVRKTSRQLLEETIKIASQTLDTARDSQFSLKEQRKKLGSIEEYGNTAGE